MYPAWVQCQGALWTHAYIKGPVPLLTKELLWTFENKQTDAICIGGSVSISYEAFLPIWKQSRI